MLALTLDPRVVADPAFRSAIVIGRPPCEAIGEALALAGPRASVMASLEEATAEGVPIAAAIAGALPVAFCYAGSGSESLWDLSVDTREPWRRRGYAARAVAFEVARLASLGKRPVWGAVDSSAPSRGLARKLGCVPVDEIWIFTAPDGPVRP